MGLCNNRIVVKVGTSTLTNDAGKSDLRAIDRLVCTLADIQNMGYEVILVSSGAIAVGRNKLNMHEKPDSMRMKQAAAAVGQCSLMYLYDKFFGDYDKTVAQILLNAEDIEQEEKKENLTNTFDALLEMGIIPIVNENDSVSYKEIESEDRLFATTICFLLSYPFSAALSDLSFFLISTVFMTATPAFTRTRN